MMNTFFFQRATLLVWLFLRFLFKNSKKSDKEIKIKYDFQGCLSRLENLRLKKFVKDLKEINHI